MVTIKEALQEVTQNLSDYIQVNLKLTALKISERSSMLLSNFFTLIILLVIFAFALMLLSVGAAKYLGHVLESEWNGFFIVGGFYVVLGIFLIALKKKVIGEPVLNSIVKGIFAIEEKAENAIEDMEEKLVDKLDRNR